MKELTALLEKTGPVALVVREKLRPVGGHDSVIFPPTYADQEGYVIDPLGDGHNRCVLDSVQSQANRIEPAFLEAPYSALVPQIRVRAGDVEFNVLEMAHRLGDASVRFSALEDKVDAAFKALVDRRDAAPVARLSPMSLILGVWDSRGTHAKVQRMLGSIIYADDVLPLSRASTYVPSFSAQNVEALGKLGEKLESKKASSVGLAHVPSKGRGGIVVRGGIVRESILNLISLRQLRGASDEETTMLRAYLLGLGLVALTLPQDYNLRSGCQLVRDGAEAVDSKLVARDGAEKKLAFAHDDVIKHTEQAAKRFGVLGVASEGEFDVEKAKLFLKNKA